MAPHCAVSYPRSPKGGYKPQYSQFITLPMLPRFCSCFCPRAVLSACRPHVFSSGRAGTHGPPPEMQLSLASLAAPKLGRAPGIADEPFAWDSREFLRKKCIGKQVGLVSCVLPMPPPAVVSNVVDQLARSQWLHACTPRIHPSGKQGTPSERYISCWCVGRMVASGGLQKVFYVPKLSRLLRD